jgi:hypothetical protein
MLNLLIEFRLLLLSPDTEALSTFDGVLEQLVMMLCVLERRFSFSASDLKGRFGVSYKHNDFHFTVTHDFFCILTSSINSKTGVFGVFKTADDGGAEIEL